MRVGIDRYDMQHTRDPPHQPGLKKFTRTDMKCVLEKFERIGRAKNERIEKALMVRTDDKWPLHRSKIFQSFYFEPHEDPAEKVEALVNRKGERDKYRTIRESITHLRDIFVSGLYDRGPAEIGCSCQVSGGVPRHRTRYALGRDIRTVRV